MTALLLLILTFRHAPPAPPPAPEPLAVQQNVWITNWVDGLTINEDWGTVTEIDGNRVTVEGQRGVWIAAPWTLKRIGDK